jgi:hypothetical protein
MKGSYLKVENYDSLVKDTNTSAIISIDDSAYSGALQRKKKGAEFNQMKNDISDLKELVSALIQKLDK